MIGFHLIPNEPMPLRIIGLFGSCGLGGEWRKPIIEELRALQIPFFNPDLGEGKWDRITSPYIEAYHFRNDALIVIPVTSSGAGMLSLLEICVLTTHLIKMPNRRAIFYIDPKADTDLISTRCASQLSGSERAVKLLGSYLSKESTDARLLITNHLYSLATDVPNMQIASDMTQLPSLILDVWGLLETERRISLRNPGLNNILMKQPTKGIPMQDNIETYVPFCNYKKELEKQERSKNAI